VNGSRVGGEKGASDAVVLGAIVALALLLRAANGWLASLHLDDFHSLFHARQATFADFLHGLRLDNHPPLHFLLVRGVRTLLGELEFALRLPAILAGTLTAVFAWRLTRGGRGVRAAAALLVACSSLNLELSADLRMYSLLALAVAGLLDGVLTLLEGQRGLWRTALWAFVGLHTHYHFVHVLGLTVVVVASACLVQRELRPRGLRCARALALAGLLSLPWFAWGFPAQIAHGLAPGGADVSLSRYLESLVHLEYLNVRLGGPLLRLGFLAAAGVVLACALAASVQGLRARSARTMLLAVLAFLLPGWSALAAWLLPRAGFEWRYVAAAGVPLAILAAEGACASGRFARTRGAALVAAIAAALLLSLLNVRDPGREDNRAAVRAILARAGPRDAVVAAEWQPRIFPHGGAWHFYAPRLAAPGQTPPPRLEHRDDFSFPPETDFSPYERVFFFGRSIPDQAAILRVLRREFGPGTTEEFGMSICVVTFERAAPPR
jgi:4-amino-4-deoxy-L-arabinose transferase-like glycosyltransferase